MRLPFSHQQFLDVFGAYNAALWPGAVLLWVATAWLVATWLGRGRVGGRAALGLLAVHWIWSAAYHWFFFRPVNPAAAGFAALFAAQGAWFAWLSWTSTGQIIAGGHRRGWLAASLVLYGLAYPGLGWLAGLEYPRLPLFAVPCPTTLITAGLLIAAVGMPPLASAGPILWAIVGSSAAFLLGMWADLALIVAGAVLAADLVAPGALGARSVAK